MTALPENQSTGVELWDRLSAREIDRPGLREPLGRFAFVDGTRSIMLDGHPTRSGHYLAGDTGSWALWVEAEQLRLSGTFGDAPTPDETTIDMVQTIAKEVDAAIMPGQQLRALLHVSPLLQDAHRRLMQHPLDRETQTHVGYLRAVCFQPAERLRPINQLVPVSRARRITSHTIARLAAHSEDWVCLRPDGVRPERVLSLQRDLHIDLYENHVASRLVDHLWRHLNQRLADLDGIETMLADARRLESEIQSRPGWQARVRLYGLFGDFVANDSTQAKLDERRDEVEGLRRTVTRLLGSPLRRQINGGLEVPLTLRRTNILTSDERYRHVADLWRTWVKVRAGAQSSESRYQNSQRWCHDFESYVLLLLVRAFHQIQHVGVDIDGAQTPPTRGGHPTRYELATSTGSLAWEPAGTFVIRRNDDEVLRVVPLPHVFLATQTPGAIARAMDDLTESAPVTIPTLVVYPSRRRERQDLQPPLKWRCFETPQMPAPGRSNAQIFTMPVSPVEIDSVTRLARSIRWAVEDGHLNIYPRLVKCASAEATAIAKGAQWLITMPEGLAVTRPPTGDEMESAKAQISALRAGTSRRRRRGDNTGHIDSLWHSLEVAAQEVTELTHCPRCGKRHSRPERVLRAREDDQTYRCVCERCKAAWETRRCRQCGRTYPIILIPEAAATDGSQFLGGDGDHLDRTYGADLLATPCWIRERVFICPRCTTCAETLANDRVDCARCTSQRGTA